MDNGESKSITRKIKVYGIVQGVGFRPLVYRIAKSLKACGTVRNIGGAVEIILQAPSTVQDAFIRELLSGRNGVYEIIKLETEDYPEGEYEDFHIIGSSDSEESSVISPDLPTCEDCIRELYDSKDRRYLNPFISCMSCGPRYTILEELPYDRENTSMRDFQMCDDCQREYTSPENRRFHAQTISCNDCGPYLIYQSLTDAVNCPHITGYRNDDMNVSCQREDLLDAGQGRNMSGIKQDKALSGTNHMHDRTALKEAVSELKSGGIIAVKGIGGYHLVCSPFTEETVEALRILKGREEKPFAVMFPDLDEIKEYCQVSVEEQALLETKARPIVLLYMKKDFLAPSVNKGSIYCGAFLPYTPLQLLLTRQCGPLIMTSANLSGSPIIREDEEILSLRSPFLKGVLYHKRRIVRSVDDSVAKVIDGKPQLIRRSRGFVPYPVFIHQDMLKGNCMMTDSPERTSKDSKKDMMVFAAGGDLKAAYCLYKNGNAVVSQYFGDLEEEAVMEGYERSFRDLSGLLKVKPSLAVCDLHPNYYSTKFAKKLGVPYIQVQHHHAHIASVIAEHDLQGKVIGVAFDGTGYGTDGRIWGGEFLICEGAQFIRAGQLKYTDILGGDESMKDAAKTAACFLLGAGLQDFVTDRRKDIIKAALEHHINTIQTSSMGRLFDAVAAILDICQENRYEGECASKLEGEAVLAEQAGIMPMKMHFCIEEQGEIVTLDPKPILENLCSLKSKENARSLALGFHYAMAEAIGDVCSRLQDRYQSNTIALSGGVFQNTVLTHRTLEILRRKGFSVYMNLAVPPNDGGISLGQAYVGSLKLLWDKTGRRD